MTPDARLAEIVAALRAAGIDCLVMGGHAVRYLRRTTRSVTQALLLPLAPAIEVPVSDVPIDPVVLNRLRNVAPASPLHFALVEIVRRRYRRVRQAADLADKEAIRALEKRDVPP
jgi:hypothetical protein